MSPAPGRERRSPYPHLPSGREPGPQTLRARRDRRSLSPLLALVGTAMFAAGVWVAAGGRGAAFDRGEELWGGLLFAAFGLLVLYVVLVVWGGAGPRPARSLRGLTLSPLGEEARRGGELELVVRGRPSGVEHLEVGLVCVERVDTEVRTQHAVRRETVETTVAEEWQAVPAGADPHTVRFDVPPDAPYSYEGDCVSFAWRVSARAPRRARPDERADEPIWVEP